MTLQKKIFAISLFSVFFPLLIFIGCSKQTKPAVIKAGYVQSASGAPIFHALEDKCFKDYTIEAQPYKSSDLLALALAKNEIQVALVCGISEILSQIAQDPNSLLILAVFESTPCVLAPKGAEKDIYKYFSKPGKKIVGTWPGATFPYYTKTILDSMKIYSDKVFITPISPGLQSSQLERREIDLLFTLEPIGVKATVDGFAEYRLKDENLLAKYISQGEYFPGGCLAISKKAATENPNLIDDLLTCLSKASKNMSPNNPITVQALAKYTSLLPNYSASLKIEHPIIGDKMIGKEMKNLIISLQKMKQLPSDFNWEKSFWVK